MWKPIELEDALLDDNYEDRGYALFNGGQHLETLDDNLDIVIAKADLLVGEVVIREEYYDKRNAEHRFSDVVWSNE